MTAYLLLRAIRRFLEQQVAGYAAASGTAGELLTPSVFDWDLPFPDPLQPENFTNPYICVRPVKGLDREDAVPPDVPDALSSTVEMEMIFGMYRGGTAASEPVSAYGYDLLNLMEQVRASLLQQRIVEGKFAIEKPYQWEISQEQPSEYWIGRAKSIWTVQSVIPVWEEV